MIRLILFLSHEQGSPIERVCKDSSTRDTQCEKFIFGCIRAWRDSRKMCVKGESAARCSSCMRHLRELCFLSAMRGVCWSLDLHLQLCCFSRGNNPHHHLHQQQRFRLVITSAAHCSCNLNGRTHHHHHLHHHPLHWLVSIHREKGS